MQIKKSTVISHDISHLINIIPIADVVAILLTMHLYNLKNKFNASKFCGVYFKIYFVKL
jgi:hypothetical protein